MSGTWWVSQGELDEDQQRVISLDSDSNVFVIGPPGSGKTNLLLLRANYLYLSGLRNIVVVTFTRPLREFIAIGASQYEFPASMIMTCREWQTDLLRQYGEYVESSGNFVRDRNAYLTKVRQVAEDHELYNIFDAILLDEAQDYTPDEIRLFARLAERLFCVADERQKIYEGDQSIDTITELIGNPYELRFHYRNGVNICRVADEIAKRWHGYQPLVETSNYDERANPSTVDCFQCGTIEEQVELIMGRLTTQRVAFPNELIGILSPTVDSMNRVWEIISGSEHSDVSFLLHGSVRDVVFPVDKQVIVSTFHAAKGLEFRALHLAGCDELRSFGNNRRMAFTAVTRAKTTLSVYHNSNLHPYFDAAIRSLEPAPRKPSMDEVFGGRQ